MKKLLLMGSEGVGKSSMHKVIFANVLPSETYKIGYTVSKEEVKIKIFGNVSIDLWDCGGQEEFIRQYIY